MPDIITRSISALPYAGGTLQTAQPTQSGVMLTANRMVWTYCQAGPAWRFFSIIDTPEGWATGGNPVVTANRMFDQRQYGTIGLHMFRINDNTFGVLEPYNNSLCKLEVFQIDNDNLITRVWSNLDSYGNTGSTGFTAFNSASYGQYSGSSTKFANLVNFMPVVDNKVLHLYLNSTRQMAYQLLTWDDSAKTLTFPAATNLPSTLDYNGGAEITWKSIPGSTKKFVTARTLSSSGTWEGGSSISTHNWIFNADGTVSNTLAPYATNANSSIGSGYCIDTTAMSETRIARLNWGNAYYFGVDGTTSQGYGPVGNSTSTKAMMAYALDANYNLLVDRSHWNSSTAGNIFIKVFRRDDSNITSQSTASATAATGYSVTAPYIDTWRCHPRPRMLANGDLFWWGLDTTGTKLTWNILKNPTA